MTTTAEALQHRIDFLEREVAGYQRIAKEAMDAEGKTVVILVQNGGEMRCYGPTPERELAFAETVARWLKLLDVVSCDLMVEDAKKHLASITTKLGEIAKTLKASPDVAKPRSEEIA